LNFVEEGFMARLYRTWMSVLTQFHFQYLWNSLISEKLESTAELDMMGIDAWFELKNKKIGIQIEKISFRREVSSRKFGKRQQKYVHLIAEIPYVIDDPEELKAKIVSERTGDATKRRCRIQLKLFNESFERYPNGFVVFRESYIQMIYKHIQKRIIALKEGKISYNEFLSW